MNVVLAILRVLVTWSILLGLFSGVGLLFEKMLGLRPAISARGVLLVSLGWCGWIAFLQIWHLFLPSDWRAFAVLSCAGTLGIILHAGDLLSMFRRELKSRSWLYIWMLLVGVWLANLATAQPQMGDSGLYHINSVQWAHAYPIVPGLGNLHARLAFNQSFFLYAGMLEFGWFIDKSHQVASGFLLLLGMFKSLGGVWRLVHNETRTDPVDVFDALFLVPVIGWGTLSGYASSPTPDAAIFVLGFMLGSELFRILYATSDAETSTKDLSGSVITVALLAATGITVKLSFLVLGGASVLAALYGYHIVGRDTPATCNLAMRTAGIAALFILPWMARGVILSGYIAFPSTFGALPVEWRVSADMARNEARWILAIGREKGAHSQEALSGWRWLWPWVNRLSREHMFDVVVPVVLTTLGVAGRFFWALPGTGRRRSKLWPLFVPPVAALIFWLLTAPDPRFAGAAFWILMASSLTVFLVARRLNGAREAVVLFAAVLLFSNINLPGSIDRWKRDHGTARRVPLVTRTTDSGLQVHVPGHGDMCWNAPLPCTPYFNPRLRLREPGNMAKGFVIDPRAE